MGGGGASGGSVNIQPRSFQSELPQISQGYRFQQQGLNNFLANNPTFNAANTGALNYYNQLPGLLNPLMQQYANYPNIQPTINNLQSQFGNLPNQLQRQFQNLPRSLMGQAGNLVTANQNVLNPIIQSGGTLTGQLARDASQQAYQSGSQMGVNNQLSNVAAGVLNRDAARQARLGTALGEYDQNAQTIQGLDTGAQGLGTQLATTRQGLGTGLAAAEQGLRGQSLAQQAGLASGIQGLQTGNLNQLIGAGQAGVSGFTGLTTPMLSYLSSLFGENLQAQIAQAQINQQGNIANQNKGGGLASGGISAVSSLLPLLAAFSDEKLKTKVKDTGLKTPEGIPLKTWQYKASPGITYLSPLAQDVEKKRPDLVFKDPATGFKRISGFPMIQVGGEA